MKFFIGVTVFLCLVSHVLSYKSYEHDLSNTAVHTIAEWESDGKTVAGGNGPGAALNQFNSSYGVSVDSDDAVFITDYFNSRVVKWEKNASSGTLYAQSQCENTDNQTQPCYPTAITFNKEGTLFFTVEYDTFGSVVSFKKGATAVETLITGNTSFYGIAWDKDEEYLYLGHHREHRVVKYTKDGKLVGVVAGGNGKGRALNQLDFPRGVAVDEDGSVYVSDSNNHRIIKWLVNASEGIIIAGGNGNGSAKNQLNIPGGIIRDEEGAIYVADEHNHRIVLIPAGVKDGTVIAGGHDKGNGSSQLNNPIYVALNSKGDLYVSDSNNLRIQMFAKKKGPPSGSNSNYICNIKAILTHITCLLLLMIATTGLFE